MSVEDNKAIVRRWSEELWSQGKLEVADEIVAPDYVRHDPGDPFPARGPEDVKRLVGMLRAMLPDLTITIEDMIGERDKVMIRYTGAATDTEGFMGKPGHRDSDSDGGDAALPPRQRANRRKLGRARRSGDLAPARTSACAQS